MFFEYNFKIYNLPAVGFSYNPPGIEIDLLSKLLLENKAEVSDLLCPRDFNGE
jgi:hypothetical protein